MYSRLGDYDSSERLSRRASEVKEGERGGRNVVAMGGTLGGIVGKFLPVASLLREYLDAHN